MSCGHFQREDIQQGGLPQMVDVCAAGIYDSVTPPSTLPENPAKNSGSTD